MMVVGGMVIEGLRRGTTGKELWENMVGFVLLCFPGGYMETEAAAQESLGLGKLGTQAEKDRRLKKKLVTFSCDFHWLKLDSNVSSCVGFMETCHEKQDYLQWQFTTYHGFSNIKVFKAAYKIQGKYLESVNCTVSFHL